MSHLIPRLKIPAFIIVVTTLATCVVLLLTARPAPPHPFFASNARNPNRPLIIAHRGGKGLWPEETMYAFEQAVELGVDVLEMDVHSTADGELVLLHDDTVERTTNGTGLINDLTLAEAQALDAGYTWTADDGQTFPFRGQGMTVATLHEVFTRFPTMRMNIEIKQDEPSIVNQLCTMIYEYNMQNRILVASFNPDTMTKFQQACPDIARSAGATEIRTFFVLNTLKLAAGFTPSSQAFQVPEYSDSTHVLTPAFITAAHSRNIQVHAWTINEVEDMQRIRNLGVDGIITDYPDRLLEVLK